MGWFSKRKQNDPPKHEQSQLPDFVMLIVPGEATGESVAAFARARSEELLYLHSAVGGTEEDGRRALEMLGLARLQFAMTPNLAFVGFKKNGTCSRIVIRSSFVIDVWGNNSRSFAALRPCLEYEAQQRRMSGAYSSF